MNGKGDKHRGDRALQSKNDTSNKCYFCLNKSMGIYKGVKVCERHNVLETV